MGFSARPAAIPLYDSLLRRKVARMWCSPFMVIVSPSSGCSQACRLPLHTGNTSRKSIRSARLRHCATIALSEQSAALACLAVQSGSDAAFGGRDDEPAATFDSAGATVAIGHSRDRGCRRARSFRAYRNPEHRRGATRGHQRSLSRHRTGTRRGTAAKLDAP